MGINAKFRNWVRNWLNKHDDEIEVSKPETIGTGLGSEHNSIRFEIHKADGGLVIETRIYDRIKDKVHNRLHVVTHDQNIGETLNKILTMESLRG